ncbi:tRNA intron endonuclease [Chytridium lagenaria]|nr:tRNA intron endonuclease [Chytridium lagenaria]
MCQIKKVLTVEDKNEKSLSLKGLKLELEKYFDPKVLALRFAALCYYKEIGWVVKDGVKFGADFVLYKGSPELFHSSYAVVLKDETTARTLSWESLMNLHRLCSQVIKDCVLCVVNEGRAQKLYAGNSNHHASVPVRHLAMKRWLPQRERDAK